MYKSSFSRMVWHGSFIFLIFHASTALRDTSTYLYLPISVTISVDIARRKINLGYDHGLVSFIATLLRIKRE